MLFLSAASARPRISTTDAEISGLQPDRVGRFDLGPSAVRGSLGSISVTPFLCVNPLLRCPPMTLTMHLYVETMDAVVVEVDREGRVRLENEELRTPTLQERRAILYAAQNAVEELNELIEILQA